MTDEFARQFGGRIREARQAKGLSQVKLAAALGTTQHVISRWERGHVMPGPSWRERLAQLLGEDLFAFREPEAPAA